MAEPTEAGPVARDPELTANLTRLLSITGPLGVLKVLDTIVPVVSLGDVVQPTITVVTPSFRSSDIFSAGVQVGQDAGTVLADTGQLAAGTYDVKVLIASASPTSLQEVDMEHRNAANAANLAVWPHYVVNDGRGPWAYEFGYVLALNERLRAVQVVADSAGRGNAAVIFARIRS